MNTVGVGALSAASIARVYELVADVLVEADVACLFGVMGEDTAPLVVAAAARGIRYYAARHENQAVAMVDGYSRASGRTGVATVTGGPGFTNALTAINTAHRAGSRVLVLTGAGRSAEDDLDPAVIRQSTVASWLKHFPHAVVLGALGIEVVRPQSAGLVEADTQAAIAGAQRGTVVLVLARSLLLETAPGARNGDRIAHDVELRHPAAADIAAFADALQETWAICRPLILAGRGAVWSDAAPALARLGEITGALLATTLPASGLFGDDRFCVGVCGTYSTAIAADLIMQADCVLAFGAGLNILTTYNSTLFPKALVMHVDSDAAAHGKFIDVDLGIAADARLTAEALVAELTRRSHQFAGFRTAGTRTAIANGRIPELISDKSTPACIDPRSLMLALDRMLPENRILCADAGQQSKFAIRHIGVAQPRNFMQPVDAGSIGLGMGAGIGAAVARPLDVVVVSVGDGAMMMSLGDLETAIRSQLRMLIVVCNDEAYGAEVNVLSDLGMETSLARMPTPSFEGMAKAMGADAVTVRAVSDLAIVERWLSEARRVPLVLECRVNEAIRAR